MKNIYHRLTRANTVLTGGNALILRQAPWQYGSIPCGSFLVWTHFRSGKTASHLTAMDFRVIFVFWDAGGLATAKAKRVKSAEKARCQACLPLSSDGIYGTDIKIDSSFKYEAFAKNPQKFGNKLIKVYGLNVVQIFEYSLWGYDVTFCLAEDSNYNMYYIYLLGYADNVYEGSNVTLTALPLDFFTYQSVLGHEVWAIACAAVSIEWQDLA